MKISVKDKEQIQAILNDVEKDVPAERRFNIDRIDKAINDAERFIKETLKKGEKMEFRMELNPKGVTMPEMLGGAEGARVTLKRFSDGWYVVDISLTRCIPKPGEEQNKFFMKEV